MEAAETAAVWSELAEGADCSVVSALCKLANRSEILLSCEVEPSASS